MKPMQVSLVAALAAAVVGTGCSKNFDQYFRVRTPSSLLEPTPAPSDDGGNTQYHVVCEDQGFNQPDTQIVPSVDILFIVDTSGSMANIRAEIASNLGAFVGQLPPGTDYRVAVMLAHGSTSPHYGKLYTSPGMPRVLDSSIMTAPQISSDLQTIMLNTVADQGSAGGEEGMVALNRAIEPDRVAEGRALGFYRTNAALAIIFIADENDVCAVYPPGVIPVRNTDGSEAVARARDCPGTPPSISAAGLVAKVREFQGTRPFTINGVIYNDLATVPTGAEKEYGYGYVDVIRTANGVSIDLARPPYSSGLAAMGSLVTTQLNLITDVKITYRDMDTTTLRVKVDGRPAVFDWQEALWSVHLVEPGVSRSRVDINYCRNVRGGTKPREDKKS